MKTIRSRGWFFLLVCFSLTSAGAQPQEPVTAFVDVNVVPMDRERVIESQTVIVRGDRIVEMGPSAKVAVPAGARRIEGKGSYLMPGLAEMHGHLPSPQTPPSVADNIVFLYVANGVTTVRGMQGHPSQFALRDRIRKGELVGPYLYLGSPSMSGASVKTVEDALRLVREYKDAGYDLLKVHEGLSREVYDTIAGTARQVGIPFGGHVTDTVGLLHALGSGQATIDHLDNYVEALLPEDRAAGMAALTGIAELLDRVDEKRIPELVRATKGAGASVVPTMVLWESGIFATRPSAELKKERVEIQYMPKDVVERWTQAVDDRIKTAGVESGRRVAELRMRILRALHQGGVRILLGTDSPQIFSVPGFSIHREMKSYVAAGMSPYEVIASGTRRAAEYFNASAEFGTVAPGKRADLLLVRANPLADVANVARREGVMVRGRFTSEEEIQARLRTIAASYASPPSP